MKQKVDRPPPSSLESMMLRVESPFTQEVLETKFPSNFRMPVIDKYIEAGDPLDHLEGYRL